MNAEIIAIGSELLLGQIIDTNSSYIAKSLLNNGIEISQISLVGDHLQRIKEAIQEATKRSQIILTTGGLGPTEDDLTREAISETIQRPLLFQSKLMEQIEARFKSRGYRMTENNKKQAYIPMGAIPIENSMGTAPGFIVDTPGWVIISIPGVPSEMEYLMEHKVIPYLRNRFQLQQQVIRYRVLRACGLGEGAIGSQIRDLMQESQNPSVGTLASTGDVKIRITARADNPLEADRLIQEVENEIRRRLGILIYGVDHETLQENVVKELEKLNLTLSVAETITGGIVSQKLAATNTPFFIQGVILPLSSTQNKFLELTENEFNSLRKEPQKLTDLLSSKIKQKFKTDLGLATFSNIPIKGNGEIQIKTFYSISTPSSIENQEYVIGGEQCVIRERSSIIALDMLRKYLLKN